MFCCFHNVLFELTDQKTTTSVHCQRGVSRSATFVIAYMMRAKGWDLLEALKYVKDRRKIVKPNTGFIVQLKEWERALQAKSFVFDAAFVRKPVSLLRESHELKSSKRYSPSPNNKRFRDSVQTPPPPPLSIAILHPDDDDDIVAAVQQEFKGQAIVSQTKRYSVYFVV